MRLGVHIRIHPQRDGRNLAHRRSHLGKTLQLRRRLHIKTANPGRERRLQLRIRFRHTGKHHLRRIAAGLQHPRQLAAGGRGVVQPLSEREWWIVEQVKPLIAEQQLYLVGLDVIGGYLTELNVTSPTCMREIEKATGQPIARRFWEGLA